MSTSTFGTRLKEIRKEAGLTQAEAAAKLNVTQQTWQSAEADKTQLASNRSRKVAQVFKVSLAWLLSGEGPKTSDTTQLKELQNKKLVKLVSGKVLAGLATGPNLEQPEIEDYIYFPGINSQKECYAIQVSSESMEPKITAGSTIILEPITDRAEFKDGKIYVLIIEGVPLLRKASILLSGKNKGKFELSSEKESKVQIVEEEDIKMWFRVLYVVHAV